jgi:hypothetical protein
MEPLIAIATIIQSVAISLGVGTSTIAIVNFFAAIADGVIDKIERHMMGYVYYVLRVAMVVILLTMLALFAADYMVDGVIVLTTMMVATIVTVAVLYVNAILMTAKIMPSTVGPALQASSWYTLGIMASLHSLGLVTFSVPVFLLGYISGIVFAVAVVNALMAYFTPQKPSAAPGTSTPPTTTS